MPLRRSQSQAGFTLVDVMMGATILVVGFISLIAAVSVGSEMLDTARKQQIAAQIIDGEIEQLRASWWSWASTVPTPAIATISAAGVPSGDGTLIIANSSSSGNSELRNVAKGFTCKREVFTVVGQSNIIRIVVTVTWKNITGRQTLSRSGEVYLTKNGLAMAYQKS